MLKKVIITALSSIFLIINPAYANQQHSNNVTMNNPATNQKLNDATIINLLITLNANEINAAKKALQKSDNTAVKDFAQNMVKDHSENRSQTLALKKELHLALQNNAQVMKLKKAGKVELKKLSSLDGKEFNVAYMDLMVQDHTNALNLINTMIENVQNAQLKTHLEATKQAIEHHLEEAKQTQSKLSS